MNENAFSISYDEIIICDAHLYNGLYVISPENKFAFNVEMFKIAKLSSNKRLKVSNDDETYLCHLRLGHININMLERISRLGPLKHLKVGTLHVCESCIE